MTLEEIQKIDVYDIAEKRYICTNSLIVTKVLMQAKIDSFIEGFNEAVKLMEQESKEDCSQYISKYDYSYF